MLDGAKSRSEVRNFTFQLGETHSYRLHFESNVACVELKFKERQLQQEIHISKHSDVREFVPPPPPSLRGGEGGVSQHASPGVSLITVKNGYKYMLDTERK